jgi:hypothetical protein
MTGSTDEAQQKFDILVIACKNGGNISLSIQIRLLGVWDKEGDYTAQWSKNPIMQRSGSSRSFDSN